MVEVNSVLKELNIPENDIVIELKRSDSEKILKHAKEGLPNEACGLVAGVEEEEHILIKEVYLLTNIDESNEHFSMDPKEQLAAIKDMRLKGLKPLGNWHSHPESPSRPSEEDKRLAHDSNAFYFILSLMEQDRPVLNGFCIKNHVDVSSVKIILKD